MVGDEVSVLCLHLIDGHDIELGDTFEMPDDHKDYIVYEIKGDTAYAKELTEPVRLH